MIYIISIYDTYICIYYYISLYTILYMMDSGSESLLKIVQKTFQTARSNNSTNTFPNRDGGALRTRGARHERCEVSDTKDITTRYERYERHERYDIVEYFIYEYLYLYGYIHICIYIDMYICIYRYDIYNIYI